MNENLLQNLHLIATKPIYFFPLLIDLQHLFEYRFPSALSEEYLLPNTGQLCKERSFATVKMGWNEEGIALDVTVQKKMEQAIFPEIHLGDGIELFFDTRNRKVEGTNTRFCHHFGFTPKEYAGTNEYTGLAACELTRFRTEDKHDLCPPQDLMIASKIFRSSYQMLIFIPSHCLHGFDPQQYDKIGFTYRITGYHHTPQHFVIAEELSIEQHPAHWASLRLIQ